MEIVFLGTGAGMPSRERNVAGVALSWLPEAPEFWLFDAGEATQHQLWNTGLSLHRLRRIFITHMHGDHIYGLPGILGSRSAAGVESPLTIFGPPGLREWIETTLRCTHVHLGFPLTVNEASPSAEAGLFGVLDCHRASVSAAWLHHGVPCLGYRIVEVDAAGSLNVAALQALGVPPGPLYGRLKRGETIVLADGSTLSGHDVVGPARPGRIVTVLGDTTPCHHSVELARHANALVHESTFDDDEQENAERFGHSTARDAARVAQRAGATMLILTHISARYQQDHAESLLHHARNIFARTELAADAARFVIPRVDVPSV